MGSIPLDNGESVYIHDGTGSADPVAISAAEGSSVANLMKNRERFDYTWANSTERTEQTGMVQGSRGYQEDTRAEYVYGSSGSVWQLTALPQQSWNPVWTNFTLGTSSIIARYEIVGSRCIGDLRVKMASGFSFVAASGVVMSLPVPPESPMDGRPVGTATYIDSGTGYYPGRLLMDSSGSVRLTYQPASFMSSIDDNEPHVWAVDDEILLEFNYQCVV